jgi:hypothetical protein
MDINDILSGMDDGDNGSNGLTETEKLGAVVGHTGIGHALCDYVLRSEENFQQFCEMLEVEDDDVANVKQGLQMSHDVFAGMAASAQSRYMMAQFFGPMGGNPGL